MRKNVLNLLKVAQSNEYKAPVLRPENAGTLETPRLITQNPSTSPENNFTSQNQMTNSSQKWNKSHFRSQNSFRTTPSEQSLSKSSSEFLSENEGLIQKRVELHQIMVSFPFPIISPYGYFSQSWNFVICMVMIYVLTIYPLRLSLIEDEADWISTDLFVDGVFLLDILINSLTAYEDVKGALVFQLHKIIINYIRGFFFIDLISAFPFYLAIEGSFNGKMPTLYKLTKLPRLFRLVKVSSFFTKLFINLKLSRQMLETLKFSIFVLFFIHLTGCIWIMLAMIEQSQDSWLNVYNLLDEDHFTIYISSIYFILTVLFTIGYGNIVAISNGEKIFVILIMIVGIGFFSYLMATLINVFAKKFSTIRNQVEEKELFYIQISQQFSVPMKTLEKILIRNQNLEISRTITKIDAFKQQEIFGDLPLSLQKDLFSFVYSELLEKIEFFHDKPHAFLIQILSNLKPLFLKKGDEVYREGDLSKEVFFILKGRIVSKCQDKFGLLRTVIFMEGGYFGETDVILRRGRSENAFAETDVEIWKLKKEDFLEALRNFKEIEFEVEKLVYEKIKVRRTANISIKNQMKALLPATYFISKVRRSRKSLKTMVQSILQRSGQVMLEMKNHEENSNAIDNHLGISSLDLPSSSGEILTINEKDIENQAIKHLHQFLEDKDLVIQEEELKSIFGIIRKTKQDIIEKREQKEKEEKFKKYKENVRALMPFVKNLKGILRSQEQELLIFLNFLKD